MPNLKAARQSLFDKTSLFGSVQQLVLISGRRVTAEINIKIKPNRTGNVRFVILLLAFPVQPCAHFDIAQLEF